jgi:cytochrome d ubiquinol oxidase subunit I
MEGLWETGRGIPASLFAIPDQKAEANHFEIAIPKLGSLYLTHDWNGEVKGLKEWAPEDRPPVAIVYFAFRIMVGIGILMLLVVIAGLLLLRRGRLFDTPWYLRLCTWTAPIGFFAVLAGWTVTEVGRQPWVIYGLMRTADAVTPSLTARDVWLSLALYAITYLFIFSGGYVLMRRIVRIGPSPAGTAEEFDLSTRAARPLSAVSESHVSDLDQPSRKGVSDVP